MTNEEEGHLLAICWPRLVQVNTSKAKVHTVEPNLDQISKQPILAGSRWEVAACENVQQSMEVV